MTLKRSKCQQMLFGPKGKFFVIFVSLFFQVLTKCDVAMRFPQPQQRIATMGSGIDDEGWEKAEERRGRGKATMMKRAQTTPATRRFKLGPR